MSSAAQNAIALLQAMSQKKASDLHLSVGSPPLYRVNGLLVPDGQHPLSEEDVRGMVSSLLTQEQMSRFDRQKELDFSCGIPGGLRFRGNLLMQTQAMGAVFRLIPKDPPTLDQLGHPPILKQLCRRRRGLILVTGPTGSG